MKTDQQFNRSFKHSKKAIESTTSREYTIEMKSFKEYCPICSKRCGIFNAYCGPAPLLRKNRNWKFYRNKQWK